MVYQTYELFPFLTVRGQLEVGASKGGLKGAVEPTLSIADTVAVRKNGRWQCYYCRKHQSP